MLVCEHATELQCLLYYTGQEKLFIQPKVGSEMRGKPVSTQSYGGYEKAVVVEVSGMGHYCGRGEYWLEDGDRLATGFLVK